MSFIQDITDVFFPKKNKENNKTHLTSNKTNYIKKYGLYILLIFGLFLMILGNDMLTGNKPVEKNEAGSISDGEHIRNLEDRLAAAISQIEGAGRVKVMVTLKNSKELVIAEDRKVNEQSTNDGSKTNTTSNRENKVVMQNNQPFVLKELEPKLEGVIIIADGANDPIVKERINIAAKTLLGVESHKIAVFPLKKGR